MKKKAKFMWGQQNIPEQIEMSLLFPSLSPLRTRKRRLKSNRLGAECMKPPLIWIFLLSAPSLPPLFPQFSLQAGGAQPRGCPGVHGHTWRGHRDSRDSRLGGHIQLSLELAPCSALGREAAAGTGKIFCPQQLLEVSEQQQPPGAPWERRGSEQEQDLTPLRAGRGFKAQKEWE